MDAGTFRLVLTLSKFIVLPMVALVGTSVVVNGFHYRSGSYWLIVLAMVLLDLVWDLVIWAGHRRTPLPDHESVTGILRALATRWVTLGGLVWVATTIPDIGWKGAVILGLAASGIFSLAQAIDHALDRACRWRPF